MIERGIVPSGSRELQVPVQLDVLQKAIEGLEDEFHKLASRLQKVTLRTIPPSPEVGGASEKPSPSQLCEIAESISEKARMVRLLRDNMATLLISLEV